MFHSIIARSYSPLTGCTGRWMLAGLMAVSMACATDPQKAKVAYVASGDQYLAEKKFPEAIIQYRNAVQQDPRFGEARLKLAETYLQTGDAPAGFREYIRAADLLPDRADVQIK